MRVRPAKPLTRKLSKAPLFLSPLTPCNTPADRCPLPQKQASLRVLIMRVGAHGDILMGTPLLAALRRAYPEAHLTWIVAPDQVQAIDANPYIDEYIRWDSVFWTRMLDKRHYHRWLWRVLMFRRALRRRNYDLFISYQPEEWPLMALGSGASTRIGIFDTFRQFTKSTVTSPNTKYYTHAYTFDDLPSHRTNQYLLPLQALNLPQPTEKRMQMGFTAEDAAGVAHFLASHGVDDRQSLVVIAPTTTWASRCWPAERYAELGNALQSQGHRVALIGSERDISITTQIQSQMQVPPLLAVNLFGFRQAAALIARADLLVSGDTGPMHVAAAVETPYLALFGPTPIADRAPLYGQGRTLMRPVPCGPCDQEFCPKVGEEHMLCLRLLEVDEVLQAVQTFLPERLPQ
jgi:ADP-heptose:LPS heptosyltransferase